MAAIAIIERNGLFTIELDQNDWTGLTVNGTPVNENSGWKFVQTTPGELTFVATADYVTTVNPNDTLLLEGPTGVSYACKLEYSDTSAGEPFSMTGTLSTEASVPGAVKGPISFSQGMMQGGFGYEKTQIFRLTTVSQNDPGCGYGTELNATVTAHTGGAILSKSSPVGAAVKLPIPPAPGATPPKSPTWYMELDGSIEDASFTVVISGPTGYTPTTIVVKGSDMKGWIAANKKEKTNQIYSEDSCGIFGFAQEDDVVGGDINWIYSITGGVEFPVVHPPVA